MVRGDCTRRGALAGLRRARVLGGLRWARSAGAFPRGMDSEKETRRRDRAARLFCSCRVRAGSNAGIHKKTRSMCCGFLSFWRRERDSNPRYSFPYTHFPGALLQPLGHLSRVCPKPRTGLWNAGWQRYAEQQDFCVQTDIMTAS